MLKLFTPVPLFILLIFSPLAHAETTNDYLEMSLIELTNIDVFTASKSLEKSDTAPATIYVVTEDEILRNGYYELKDILANTPGVSAIDTSFFLFGGQRGFLGNFSQTLILVDGREMQNLLAAETFISHQFATHNIKQIEIINGPGSALYGANAFVGVINIITKQGDKDFEDVEVTLDAGTENTKASSAVFAKRYADLRIAGSMRVSRSNNWDFSEFVNDPDDFSEGFPAIVHDTINTSVNGDNYRNKSESIPISLRLDYKNVYFGLESYTLQNSKGLENVALDYNAQEDVREFQSKFIGWNHSFADNTQLNIEYQHYKERIWGTNYNFDQAIFDNLVSEGRDPLAPLTDQEIHHDFALHYSQENSSGSERHRFNTQLDTIINNEWNLIVGYTFDQLDILGVSVSRDDPIPDFDETVSFDNPLRQPFYKTDKHSLYAQLQKAFYKNSLHMTLGGRVDEHDIYGTINTFRGGLVYQASHKTNFKLLYGEAFREPTIFEQGASNDQETPFNDNLKPAKIDTYELAINHQFSTGLNGQLVVYHNEVTDLLKPSTTVDFVNSSETLRSRGIESILHYKRNKFSGDLAYTYTDPEDTLINNQTIKYLNVPEHRFSIGINYDFMRSLRFNSRINYYSDIEAEHGNPDIEEIINIPSSTKVDLTLSTHDYNYHDLKISFMLSMKNAFNEDQYMPNVRNGGPKQFLQPGRQFISRVVFTF